MSSRVLCVVGLAVAALAQKRMLPPGDPVVVPPPAAVGYQQTSWYAGAVCGAAAGSGLQGLPTWRDSKPPAVCLAVPGNVGGSYISYCNAARTGGNIAMCTDAACAMCGGVGQNVVFRNGQCVPVPAAVAGGAYGNVAVNCSASPLDAPDAPVDAQAVVVTYNANVDCTPGTTAAPGYAGAFTTSSGLCNRVSEVASMIAECNGDSGAGVYHQYASPDCTGPDMSGELFTDATSCLVQPGGPSLSIACALAPPPSPSPSSTPSVSPSFARSSSPSPLAAALRAASSGAPSSYTGALLAGLATMLVVAVVAA